MDFGPKSIFSSKDAAKWRKSVNSFFCWKDVLLYGDTCYLIFRRGLEFGKVGRGEKGVPVPTVTPEIYFFLVQGTFVAYETSAGLFPTDYLRPEFTNSQTTNNFRPIFQQILIPDPPPPGFRLCGCPCVDDVC